MIRTDKEIVESLRKLLSKQIAWYEKHIEDEDYLYDETYTQFEDLGRGDFASILSILINKE